MPKLKIIFKSKIFLCFLCVCFIIRCFFVFTIPKESAYTLSDTEFVGKIQEIKKDEEKIYLSISTSSEVLSGTYQNTHHSLSLELNDLVSIRGTLKGISSNTNFFEFNYQEYAKRKNKYYLIDIKNIAVLKKNKNWFYKVKNFFRQRIETFSTAAYLYAFLLGDTSYIKEEIINSYRNNGISHLFAISGMHVSFLMAGVLVFLKKFRLPNKIQFSIIACFLSLYAFLVDFSPSILRSGFFFLLLLLNHRYHLFKNPFCILLTIFLCLMFVNPFYAWDIGFQYSFAISFVLILFSSTLQRYKNYWTKLFITSYLAFLVGAPISVYHFHQLQVFSIFYNLLFVPFVSFIIFPLSFLVFLCPQLEFIYRFFLTLLEKISLFLEQLDWGLWTMRHPGILGLIFLIVVLWFGLIVISKKKMYFFLFPLLSLYFYHHINFFIAENYMVMFDVKQGDAILLYIEHRATLIDTGGSIYKDYAQDIIIPFLKAKGIAKIETLVLTHGDFDHMGEAINLVENFKIDKVILNCGEHNDLEKDLIKVLDKKNIRYSSCIDELNIGKYSLRFLKTREYNNENDNSNVIYFNYNNYKFLFMGDAGVEKEKDILGKYNLKNIDFLKVGHHGSNTSSSKEFIDSINPKYSLISVGKNNRYGHPKKSVLDILRNSKVYRTDLKGSIEIKLNKNRYEIRICCHRKE